MHKRLKDLIEDPNGDAPAEGDITLLKQGLLILNWTEVAGRRVHPFVSPAPAAVHYYEKYGKLTPANKRTLKSLVVFTKEDEELTQTAINNHVY